jgi:hypothetical protein
VVSEFECWGGARGRRGGRWRVRLARAGLRLSGSSGRREGRGFRASAARSRRKPLAIWAAQRLACRRAAVSVGSLADPGGDVQNYARPVALAPRMRSRRGVLAVRQLQSVSLPGSMPAGCWSGITVTEWASKSVKVSCAPGWARSCEGSSATPRGREERSIMLAASATPGHPCGTRSCPGRGWGYGYERRRTRRSHQQVPCLGIGRRPGVVDSSLPDVRLTDSQWDIARLGPIELGPSRCERSFYLPQSALYPET